MTGTGASIIGYDIGGAHLKVAVARNGVVTDVRQIACPLWRGLDNLETALEAVMCALPAASGHHVTMTGELADVFPDRYTGVVRIVETVAARLGPGTRYWMGQRGFGAAADAIANHDDVGSTNFLAAGELVAARLPDRSGLLIDMGSTTTDIVPFLDGRARLRALDDAGRLASAELVYTGLTRTAVMAVTDHGFFEGRRQGLARDPFATMADVYRALGELPDGVDVHATADGRGTSQAESCARLARCFGRDFKDGTEAIWQPAARHVAHVQLQTMMNGVLQVLSATPECGHLVVSAGIGSHIVGEIARRIGAGHVTFAGATGITGGPEIWATRCAPAVAMALLDA